MDQADEIIAKQRKTIRWSAVTTASCGGQPRSKTDLKDTGEPVKLDPFQAKFSSTYRFSLTYGLMRMACPRRMPAAPTASVGEGAGPGARTPG